MKRARTGDVLTVPTRGQGTPPVPTRAGRLCRTHHYTGVEPVLRCVPMCTQVEVRLPGDRVVEVNAQQITLRVGWRQINHGDSGGPVNFSKLTQRRASRQARHRSVAVVAGKQGLSVGECSRIRLSEAVEDANVNCVTDAFGPRRPTPVCVGALLRCGPVRFWVAPRLRRTLANSRIHQARVVAIAAPM